MRLPRESLAWNHWSVHVSVSYCCVCLYQLHDALWNGSLSVEGCQCNRPVSDEWHSTDVVCVTAHICCTCVTSLHVSVSVVWCNPEWVLITWRMFMYWARIRWHLVTFDWCHMCYMCVCVCNVGAYQMTYIWLMSYVICDTDYMCYTCVTSLDGSSSVTWSIREWVRSSWRMSMYWLRIRRWIFTAQ